MTRLKVVLLVAVLLVVAAGVGGLVGAGAAIALVKSSYNGPVDARSRTEVVVHSEVLGETVVLGLHLPTEYSLEPDRTFPVLWVLDGPAQGTDVHRSTQTLARIGAAEPSIVVEVPHSGSGRTADFTPPNEASTGAGHADRYLRFLESEAIPAVEETFRTASDRVLIGHSLGGLLRSSPSPSVRTCSMPTSRSVHRSGSAARRSLHFSRPHCHAPAQGRRSCTSAWAPRKTTRWPAVSKRCGRPWRPMRRRSSGGRWS